MFERDYLMRLIAELGAAIRRSLERDQGMDRTATDSAQMLEAAVGVATELDGVALLSLSPESIAQVIEVSGTDPRVTEYIARSLLLCSRYYAEDGNEPLADLRAKQAFAIADAYGHDLAEDDASPEAIEAFLDRELLDD